MIEINLVPESFRKKRKHPAFNLLNFPIEIIIGIVVLLVAINVLLGMVVIVKYAQFNVLKKEQAKISGNKKRVDAVIMELRSLQNKTNSVEKVTTGQRVFWAVKLNDVSDMLPRGIWLNKVAFDEKIFLIDGSAIAKLSDEMAGIGNFASSLQAKKTFMDGLGTLDVGSIQKRQIKTVEVADFLITVKTK